MMQLARIDSPSALKAVLDGIKPEVVDYFAKRGITKVPDENYMAHSWEPLIASDAGVVLGLLDGAQVGGIFMGLVVPDMLTAEPVGVEVFWFVAPPHRALSLALLDEFERIAKARGCQKILAGSSWTRQGAMRRMYRRLGYQVVGEQFEKVI